MTTEQMRQDLSVIKTMIEKTKKDVAESGSIFIFIGIGAIVFILAVILAGMFFNQLVIHTMIGLTAFMAIIGYFVVGRKEQKEKVKYYPKIVAHTIIVTCCVPGVLTGLIFPLTKVYSFHLAPLFAAIMFGIMQISLSVVYEIRYLLWAGLVSWIGACIIAYFPGYVSAATMIAILIIGFIIPGIILNKKSKEGQA